MLARAARSRTTPARPARNGIHYRFREARPGGAICICMSKFLYVIETYTNPFIVIQNLGFPSLPSILISNPLSATTVTQ
jgi:hypothetical protein